MPKPAQKAPEPERKVEKSTATTAVATKSTQTAAAESKPPEVLSVLCHQNVGMTVRANSLYPQYVTTMQVCWDNTESKLVVGFQGIVTEQSASSLACHSFHDLFQTIAQNIGGKVEKEERFSNWFYPGASSATRWSFYQVIPRRQVCNLFWGRLNTAKPILDPPIGAEVIANHVCTALLLYEYSIVLYMECGYAHNMI